MRSHEAEVSIQSAPHIAVPWPWKTVGFSTRVFLASVFVLILPICCAICSFLLERTHAVFIHLCMRSFLIFLYRLWAREQGACSMGPWCTSIIKSVPDEKQAPLWFFSRFPLLPLAHCCKGRKQLKIEQHAQLHEPDSRFVAMKFVKQCVVAATLFATHLMSIAMGLIL